MRDAKKYVYYTVGILRNSPLHKDLIQEAEELGKKQVPTMIAIWLRDFRLIKGKSPMALPPVVEPVADIKPTIEPVDDDLTMALANAAEADEAWP